MHSVRALKGHFTRYTTEAAALMTTLAAVPNAKSLERLEDLLERSPRSRTNSNQPTRFLGVNHDEHNAMYEGLAKTYTKEVDNNNSAIAKWAVPTPALDTSSSMVYSDNVFLTHVTKTRIARRKTRIARRY